jgi:AhpD family alkylhydroperoxidase
MNQLNPRERELVSLGAALASNCIPCIDHHIPLARKLGLTDFQIREAIELADQVRQVPAKNVLAAAAQALGSGSEKRGPLPEAAQCADLGKHSSQCC